MTDESIPPGRMIERIRSKSMDGRRALVRELISKNSRSSQTLLLEMLSDESWSLRELATEALAECGDSVADDLIQLVDDGLWFTRAAAARTLGLMAHAAALPRLIELSENSNHTVAEEASRALLDLGQRGWAVGVARAMVALGAEAEPHLVRMERVDPDAGRKIRILVARDEVRAPVLVELAEEAPDPEVLEEIALSQPDSQLGVEWDAISGPVGT